MSWGYKILDEMGSISRGRSKHRPRNDPSLFGGEFPFIQTADVKNANFYLTEYSQTYNDKGLAQSKLWPVDTLCITIAANIADTAILGIPACFPDSVMGFRASSAVSDVRFVKYCFDILQKDCQQISQGTAQDNLSWEKLSTIKFPCPPIEVQQKIASILSAYDSLIENNKKQIKLLEEAAQRLYKEWFVDLRFPGHENVKIVDGVPEGWDRCQVGDLLTLQRGFDLPNNERVAGIYPILSATGICGTHNQCKAKGPGLITGRSGSLGKVIFVEEDFWPLNTTLWVKEFKKTTPFHGKFLLQSLDVSRFNGGVAVPTLNRNGIHRLDTLQAPNVLIQQFSSFVQQTFQKQHVLEKQNSKLAETRDSLLPKLMNGEIEV